MTSNTVAQQRDRQEKGLKRFVTYSLAGSFVLHGGFLWLKVHDIWRPQASEPEEITIIVTESPEEPAEVPPPEEFIEPLDSELATADSGAPGAATFVEPVPAPQATQPEEPLPEEEPEPEPTPLPLAEAIEEPVEATEEPVEEATEPPVTEPPEELAEADTLEETPETQPRDLQNLLEELRRARQQTTATSNPDRQPTTTGSATPNNAGVETGQPNGNGTSPTAVAPNPFGSGLSPSGGDGEGSNGSGESSSDGDGSNRGSQSREIRCRGCDFDYPDSADGAEGTAQVVVETNEQGEVISVTLSGSSGNPELDRAALEQAREKVRLEGARAGESYPIEIDFVQPGSEAAERIEERGNRTSITVSEPEPDPAPAAETPATDTPETAAEPPTAAPSLTEPSGPEPQPNTPVTPSAEPSGESLNELLNESPNEADALLNPPANSETPAEATSPELAPEPESQSEPEFIPEPEPEPVYVPEYEPEYVPEYEPAPVAEPEPLPLAPEPEPAASDLAPSLPPE